MKLDTKIEQTEALLQQAQEQAHHPVLMWSGGKDSMVLLHILRRHGIDLPVIHHRDGESGRKYEFADRIIGEWKLAIRDYLPFSRALKQRGDRIEIVSAYEIGPAKLLVLPKNLFETTHAQCGVEWLSQPTARFDYPFDLILHGHKSSDVDEYEGPVPLHSAWVKQPGVPDLVFPLANWTDADIWEYTSRNDVPQDANRYHLSTGANLPDHTLNTDWRDMCTRCLDLRAPAVVRCPKTSRPVQNVSHNVARMDTMPSYIQQKG